MTYQLFGNMVEFISVDQPQKIRGRKRNVCFINEGNELTWEDFFQLNIRTTDKIIIDYNPSDEFHWIYDKLIPRDDADFFITTYKDNPFLDKDLVNEIERLQEADETHWQVYGLGQRGSSKETIYTHWKPCKEMPEGETWYGLDFGYNNPSALVKIVHYEGAIYADEMLYERKLTTNDLAEKLKEMGIGRYDEIFCDNAEPKTIEELYRAGFNAKPCDKKDVKEGIRKIKSMPLFVTDRSVNIVKEIKSYKWKVDKNEVVLDVPVKFNDHCFVGETQIKTLNGLSSLKNIREGDMVLTSDGFKEVKIKWNNGRHLVNKYRMQFDTFSVTLDCTPNHLIKTNEGWKQIQELQSGMTVYLSKSSIKEDISSILANDISRVATGECTLMYGSITTEKCQKGSMCITKAKTRGTIQSAILNSNLLTNTYQNIRRKDLSMILSGESDFSGKELSPQEIGTRAKRVFNGTRNRLRNRDSDILISELANASNAEKSLRRKQNMQSSAILTARLRHFEQGEKRIETVYDLTVDSAHEYFANGVLVHNCMDAMRYAVFTKLAKPNYEILVG